MININSSKISYFQNLILKYIKIYKLIIFKVFKLEIVTIDRELNLNINNYNQIIIINGIYQTCIKRQINTIIDGGKMKYIHKNQSNILLLIWIILLNKKYNKKYN